VQKITLTMPADLIEKVKTRVRKGGLSRYIAEATEGRLVSEEREALRATLIEGYKFNAERDLALAEEAFVAEQEVYKDAPGHKKE